MTHALVFEIGELVIPNLKRIGLEAEATFQIKAVCGAALDPLRLSHM